MFSGSAEYAIEQGMRAGTLFGATAQARNAAVRFLRLAGARVIVEVRREGTDSSAVASPAVPSIQSRPTADGGLAALNALADGHRARDLINQADDLHGPAAERLYSEAERLLAAALQEEASSCTMLSTMGKLRLSQARGAAPQGALQLLDDALGWFDRALSIKTDFFVAKVGRGDVLLEMSRRNPPQSEAHLVAAIRDYKAALQIRSDLYLARVGLGNAYLEEARHRGGGEATKLLMDSKREFGAALELKPSLYRALVGLGDVLLEQSKTFPLTKADTALASAWNHYQQALELRPSLYSALCGCGDVELERARRGETASAGSYRASAISMFERALAIQPSSYRAATGRRAALDASLEQRPTR